MDNSLKFFLIGLTIGITTSIIIDLSEDNTGFMKSFVTGGFKLWHLLYMIIMITTVPFIAIEPLKKRFKRNYFLPFPFLAGNSTGFLFLGIVGTILSVVN